MITNINRKLYQVGIVGTGFIARGLMLGLSHYPELVVGKVLTRRKVVTIDNLPVNRSALTNDLYDLINQSDLIVECTGDVVYGTEIVEQALLADVPVVTMNSELQLTTGSYLCRLGRFVEAEGDQPGTLAALDQEVRAMGFQPIVYGNIKGFLNLNPAQDDMEYWAKLQGIQLDKVTAFTDGTKVQVEQALVANGLGATIVKRGMSAFNCKSYEDGARYLGKLADQVGEPLSDYVVSHGAPAGVFIVAHHDKEQKEYLKYLKLGDGPHYVIIKPYHLCHLEIPKTILKVLKGDSSYQFNNGSYPKIQVVAVAKTDIKAGEKLDHGLGSFVLRGDAVKIDDEATGVPIGLMYDAEFVKPVAKGQIVHFADVKLPETRAYQMWQQILNEVLDKRVQEDRVKNLRIRVENNRTQVPVFQSLFSLDREKTNQAGRQKS